MCKFRNMIIYKLLCYYCGCLIFCLFYGGYSHTFSNCYIAPKLPLTVKTAPSPISSCTGTQLEDFKRRSAVLKLPTLWRRLARTYEIRPLFTFLILLQTGSPLSCIVDAAMSNKKTQEIILVQPRDYICCDVHPRT